MASKPICVDASHWQSDPLDFNKAKGAGIKGIILKATEGLSYVDPTFKDRRSAAQAAGLPVVSYHYLKAGSGADVPSQMQNYLSVVNPKPGERMILDVEDTGTTLNDVTEAVTALLADTRKLQVSIYSSSLIKELLGSTKNDYLAANTSLWLAQYTSGTPSWPTATWPQYSLWQYSDSGQVSGFNGPVDVSVFNGTDDNFVKWMQPAVAPAPTSNVPVVEVSINSDRPIQLKLTLNEFVTAVTQSHTNV